MDLGFYVRIAGVTPIRFSPGLPAMDSNLTDRDTLANIFGCSRLIFIASPVQRRVTDLTTR